MKTLTLAFQNVILQGAGTNQQKAIVYATFTIIGIAFIIAFGHHLK